MRYFADHADMHVPLKPAKCRLANLDTAEASINTERAALGGMFPVARRQLDIAAMALSGALANLRGEEE
jgi:hypothetical protein